MRSILWNGKTFGRGQVLLYFRVIVLQVAISWIMDTCASRLTGLVYLSHGVYFCISNSHTSVVHCCSTPHNLKHDRLPSQSLSFPLLESNCPGGCSLLSGRRFARPRSASLRKTWYSLARMRSCRRGLVSALPYVKSAMYQSFMVQSGRTIFLMYRNVMVQIGLDDFPMFQD